MGAIIVCAVMWKICCKASGKPAAVIVDESPQLDVEVSGDPTRKDLIRWVFQRFDSDCDDKLNKDEMPVFAKVCCNFDGDSKDWAARYTSLCEKFDVPLEQ